MIGRPTTSEVYPEYALDHQVNSSCLAMEADGNE
jgi:hypothetical protein